MKPLSEQDHYETLELSRGASPEEIERAYRVACATYSPDSLAGYSVFEEGDCELLRERVEVAYRTLSDPQMRESYDASLAAQREAEAPEATRSESVPAAAGEAPPPVLRPHDDLEDFDDGSGVWNGPRLRRARLQQGVELEQIAEVTKVSPTYLEFIEEERFDGLPAAVYVRGFVMGYAGFLGIDPKTVAGSYMEHFQQAPQHARRRLFSRR